MLVTRTLGLRAETSPQVECDIVTLRIARVGGDVKFRNFKARKQK